MELIELLYCLANKGCWENHRNSEHLSKTHNSSFYGEGPQLGYSSFDFRAPINVTIFVPRLCGNGKERTGKNRINGTLQAIDIASNCGETVAIASFMKNGCLSLLISGS
jgi:hypothetical protein